MLLDVSIHDSQRRCTKCCESKPLECFRKAPRGYWCDVCRSRYHAKWRLENKEVLKLKRQEWFQENKETVNEAKRKWRAKNKDKMKAQTLRQKYGLTEERYKAMLADSGGLCAICSQPFNGVPCVDHDHTTGAVRELLCTSCNVGLGNLRDSVKVLESAIAYLKKHGGGA